jgi:hypothetical protein
VVGPPNRARELEEAPQTKEVALMRRMMLAKEDDRKAHVPRSSLGGPARNTLYDGLNTGIMSRQRALRLLGGTILSGMLVPITVPMTGNTPAAAAANPLPVVLGVLNGIATAWELGEKVYNAAKPILGLEDEEVEQVAYYIHEPNRVGGDPIEITARDNDSPSSNSNIETLTLDDIDQDAEILPAEAAKKGDKLLADPTETELEAYNRLQAAAPNEIPNDTWFTARQKLQLIYPQLKGHDWSMLQAFFYTQLWLRQPDWNAWLIEDSQNYRLTEDGYLQYFTEYGLARQKLANIKPQLSVSGMEDKAEEFYKRLRKNWYLDQLYSHEANSLAWALYLS